ncbi:LOW QUALITY PROTEIN: neuferricin-like [Homarus americanus]|uniref:LOW QUALITY PROTEIN: neuferricin-like n=1 Tax=Homarus americanus TaxID=6706 RepID=UPI001C456C81|nr:LOW QUALITY PROTEIN: neuferricin-like [Homarus americanus]
MSIGGGSVIEPHVAHQQGPDDRSPPSTAQKGAMALLETLTSGGPYLALLGRVYNVKEGKQHYGPGGGYEFLVSSDGSRAFVSGDFTRAGLNDDVSGLTSADYIGLVDWVKFYDKDYKYVAMDFESYSHRDSEDKKKKMFPPCNSEWSADSGSRVFVY